MSDDLMKNKLKKLVGLLKSLEKKFNKHERLFHTLNFKLYIFFSEDK